MCASVDRMCVGEVGQVLTMELVSLMSFWPKFFILII